MSLLGTEPYLSAPQYQHNRGRDTDSPFLVIYAEMYVSISSHVRIIYLSICASWSSVMTALVDSSGSGEASARFWNGPARCASSFCSYLHPKPRQYNNNALHVSRDSHQDVGMGRLHCLCSA